MRKRKHTKRKRKTTNTRPSPKAKRWAAGISALGNERWEEAADIFLKSLKGTHNPVEQIPFYRNLANCYMGQGLYDDALAVWEQVANITKDEPDLWFGRAVAYGCMGHPEEAIAAFEQFQQMTPALASRLAIDQIITDLQQEQLGEIARGSFLYEHLDAQLEDNIDLGDYDLVERKTRQMIGINTGRPDAHFALGLALLRQKQPEAAVAAFLDAHELEPDYIPTLYNIGCCFFRLNQPEQAITWLDRALQQDETYVAALQIKGEIYEQLGQRAKAIAQWQQALVIDPSYEPAQYTLFEAGTGPEPEETPSELTSQLQQMSPIVKARMRKPQVYHNGDVILTLDRDVGFVLEDTGNVHNGTIYAGGPFGLAKMNKRDIHHFVGILKLMVQQANKYNCRDMAILAYYPDQPSFNYRLELTKDGLQNSSNGRLLSDQAPSHLKVRVDSDLKSPYGSPFSGYFIYLGQGGRSGMAVITLGLEDD
ncbi:MAG: tetratricopeptide repeat protein [Chloroflexi bacterium]|nr:tetratricopeptide repeat protein [Chloroflexota bacterium]